jgi:hypothetical protein
LGLDLQDSSAGLACFSYLIGRRAIHIYIPCRLHINCGSHIISDVAVAISASHHTCINALKEQATEICPFKQASQEGQVRTGNNGRYGTVQELQEQEHGNRSQDMSGWTLSADQPLRCLSGAKSTSAAYMPQCMS